MASQGRESPRELTGRFTKLRAEPQQPRIATIGGKEYFGNTAGLGITETIEQLKIDVRDRNNRIRDKVIGSPLSNTQLNI